MGYNPAVETKYTHLTSTYAGYNPKFFQILGALEKLLGEYLPKLAEYLPKLAEYLLKLAEYLSKLGEFLLVNISFQMLN